MDIMMPKINGLQALDQLKKDPETKAIPVIVFTNLANVNDEHDVLARGALKYVDKSQYDPRKVVELIKEVLATLPVAAVASQTPVTVSAAAQAPASGVQPQPVVSPTVEAEKAKS